MKSKFFRKRIITFSIFALFYRFSMHCSVNCNLPACSFDILGGPEASFVQDTLSPLNIRLKLLDVSELETEGGDLI